MRILDECREALVERELLETLEQALSHVEERSAGDQETFTGVPDMSHEPRPEERGG